VERPRDGEEVAEEGRRPVERHRIRIRSVRIADPERDRFQPEKKRDLQSRLRSLFLRFFCQLIFGDFYQFTAKNIHRKSPILNQKK
jgi:hypothetical protein